MVNIPYMDPLGIITDWVDVKKLPDYYLDHLNSWGFAYKCDLKPIAELVFPSDPKRMVILG